MVTTKSKAFVIERREAMLVFPEDSEYHGAEIRAKLDVDVKTFLDLQKISDSSDATEVSHAFTLFGNQIIKEWNIEDEDGKAVPPTGEGFMTLPPAFCTAVIGAWAETAAQSGKV